MEIISCREISVSFDGVLALDNVSLRFASPGIIAIIGPNGAGKTTLFNVLTGLLRPSSGHFYCGSRDITNLPTHQIAKLGIARTFQDLRLIQQVSVLDNVLLARPSQTGENLIAALVRYRVAEEEAHNREKSLNLIKAVGLQEEADKRAGELSYGQQKLLTLACCLATEARIFLLDEPVAGVHPDLILEITNLMRQFRHEGRLVVFVEHDISVVRQIADSVIVMDEGKVIAQGITHDTLERPEILEAYLG